MIYLPTVTQVVIDCLDADRAENVLHHNLTMCKFASSKLLSSLDSDSEFLEPISDIRSRAEYSRFCLRELAHHFDTEHVLVCQYDGYIRDPKMWDAEFLQYDYIGAPWIPDASFATGDGRPWTPRPGPTVGNGGFSLRSRALQQFLAECPDLVDTGVEDVDISHNNRGAIEARGLKFAPHEVAMRFSWETGEKRASFGSHGRFRIPRPISRS